MVPRLFHLNHFKVTCAGRVPPSVELAGRRIVVIIGLAFSPSSARLHYGTLSSQFDE
jgi:hypothetical protein